MSYYGACKDDPQDSIHDHLAVDIMYLTRIDIP